MGKKRVYNVKWYDNDEAIETTQIDELDEQLIWDLFKEFGFIKTESIKFEIEEDFEID